MRWRRDAALVAAAAALADRASSSFTVAAKSSTCVHEDGSLDSSQPCIGYHGDQTNLSGCTLVSRSIAICSRVMTIWSIWKMGPNPL